MSIMVRSIVFFDRCRQMNLIIRDSAHSQWLISCLKVLNVNGWQVVAVYVQRYSPYLLSLLLIISLVRQQSSCKHFYVLFVFTLIWFSIFQVLNLRQKHSQQQKIVNKLIHFLMAVVQPRLDILKSNICKFLPIFFFVIGSKLR